MTVTEGQDHCISEGRIHSKCQTYSTFSSIARIHSSKNQGVEIEIIPLTITPNGELKIVFPILMTLCLLT